MIVVSERYVRLDDPPVLFKEDAFRSVDHNIRNALLLQQQFQWAETECFVKDFFDEAFPLRTIQERVFCVAKMLDDDTNLPS